MFVDRARIRVTGGAGGNGCCSFRREKYVPRGGPNGGDGGDGGNVYFVADDRLTSLLDLHFHAHWKGESGTHGRGKNCHGKRGSDVFIRVPPGTVIRDEATGAVRGDLTEPGQQFLAARGGRGGMGNARFATSTDRAPKFAQLGEPGEEAEYTLELKLIAEVGLVGLPNAGKSTFLAAVSAARPKIADYPFTTLSPNLGVAQLSDYRTLTIADIPGIIEGAAEGKGLGVDFLRHIERTKVLLFLIDLGDDNPKATRDILEKELRSYSEAFADRPRLYALNKCDVPANRTRFKKAARAFEQPFMISGATGEGTRELLERAWLVVHELRQEEAQMLSVAPPREYAYEPPYVITPTAQGFRIEGEHVRRAVKMTDFANEAAVRHLQQTLDRMGVFKALKRMGAHPGQCILIGDRELEYQAD